MLKEMANRQYISITKRAKPNRSISPIPLYRPKKSINQVNVGANLFKKKMAGKTTTYFISNCSLNESMNKSSSKNPNNSICSYNTQTMSSSNSKIRLQKPSTNLSISTHVHSKSFIEKSPNKKGKKMIKNNSVTEINTMLHENNKGFIDLIQKKYASSCSSTKRTKSTDKDYYKSMETLLTELRTKGFDKYQEEIRKKMNLKKELETSISTLQNELIMYNNKKRYWLKENGKVVQKINELKSASERYKSMNFDLDVYHKHNPDAKKDHAKGKDESVQKEKEISSTKGEISILQEKIKKMNKMIFDMEKSNDNLRNQISIVKKHSDILRTKIEITDKNNNEVILGMASIFTAK